MGDVIRFAAPDKARWLEGLAMDRDLTDFDVRVCVLVARSIDRVTGLARVGQESIAAKLNSEARSVRRSIDRIITSGYLKIIAAGGGRGSASTYEPVRMWLAESGFDAKTRTAESGYSKRYTRTPRRRNPDSAVQETRTAESSPPIRKNFLEEPPPVSTPATASYVERQQGGSAEVINRGECTFHEFWEASGRGGEWGPAWAAWSKLPSNDRTAIGSLVLQGHILDLGGAWAATWLSARGWECATPQRGGLMGAADRLIGEIEGGVRTLKPHSIEWNAERERMIAAGKSVAMMDSWASEERGWTIRVDDARRAS